MPIVRAFYIYVSKDVRIRDYFAKPTGFRQQIRLGNNELDISVTCCILG